ncbi:MAG: hypothetical protein JXA82_02440 [Sedimentisphaerales bacterium]|nr:hypothetical protein [Sedimentisphaerales bacterium]
MKNTLFFCAIFLMISSAGAFAKARNNEQNVRRGGAVQKVSMRNSGNMQRKATPSAPQQSKEQNQDRQHIRTRKQETPTVQQQKNDLRQVEQVRQQKRDEIQTRKQTQTGRNQTGNENKQAGKDKGKSVDETALSKAKGEVGQAKQTRKEVETKTRSAEKTEAGKAGPQQKGKEQARKEQQNVGKEHTQQRKAVEKQLVHEQQKHLQRKARLERLLELATKKGDDKAVARVRTLIGKEQSRLNKKVKRVGQQIISMGEKGKDAKDAPRQGRN